MLLLKKMFLPGLFLWALQATSAQAQVFEIIHPDVDKGKFKLEVLTGVTLSDVESGEERSAYEFALGYAPTDFWKPTIAVELADIEGGNLEVEGFEFTNVFLFTTSDKDHGHDDEDHGHDDEDHGHDHDEHGHGHSSGDFALGLFAGLEIPNEGGFDEGAVEIGPIGEVTIGSVDLIGNVIIEIPFKEEDPGLAYAFSASTVVSESVALGIEAYGELEEFFAGTEEESHFIGPAAYFETSIGNDRVFEPRVALLFGLNEEAPDTVLSFNLEMKF